MANSNHLSILKKGVEVWNAWRKAGRSKSPVIPRADFLGPDLSKVDLQGFDLRKAYLVGVRFRQSNLQRARFDRANLRGADLCAADLRRAVFVRADISQADLSMADLRQADLQGADLRESRFQGSTLERANLQFADIRGTIFNNVNLTGCKIGNALLLSTVFSDTALRNVKGFGACIHEGPSSIDYHTLAKSDRLPVVFLQGCGLSDGFINRLPKVLDESAPLRCFISYSVKDEKLVDRLHSDLQKRGIRCWYFRHSARWGEQLWKDIEVQINRCDRFILVCSKHSLQSKAVLREMRLALERERREKKKGLLYPIRVDEYVVESWKHPSKRAVISKTVGDFRGWTSRTSYTAAFARFVETLAS